MWPEYYSERTLNAHLLMLMCCAGQFLFVFCVCVVTWSHGRCDLCVSVFTQLETCALVVMMLCDHVCLNMV